MYKGTGVKYHRARIEGAHALLEKPLDEQDIAVLDAFDATMESPQFIIQFRLKSGQILMLKNHFMCHDRISFQNSAQRVRHYERYWAGQRIR